MKMLGVTTTRAESGNREIIPGAFAVSEAELCVHSSARATNVTLDPVAEEEAA